MEPEKNQKTLDFILFLLKNKKLLIYTLLISVLLSVVVSLLLPLWYRSSAKVFFPQQNSGFEMDMGAILGGLPIDLGQTGAIGHERLYSIFSSRVFLDDIIEKFDLQNVYGQDFLFKTREKLLENIGSELNYIDQSITVSFDYKEDPEKAFQICTYLLDKANEINIKLNSKEAHNNRVFIEKTYIEAQKRISKIEDSLDSFQEKYGVYLLDEQMAATIEIQAIQEQQLIEAKIEYNYLKNIVNRKSAKLKNLELKIETIESLLRKSQQSTPDFSVLLPLQKVSKQALSYYKLKRELEIGAKVLEFLTPQYEQAKIDENLSKPSFIILDPPDIPEYKFKPKRAFVVIGATSLIMILMILYLLIVEAIMNLKSTDISKHNKIKLILSNFKIYLR